MERGNGNMFSIHSHCQTQCPEIRRSNSTPWGADSTQTSLNHKSGIVIYLKGCILELRGECYPNLCLEATVDSRVYDDTMKPLACRTPEAGRVSKAMLDLVLAGTREN